ncbi:unnamed protein product [Prorocentrum cordatum]|uniref:Uncharacterized protein n=1 Tax=Prorocentrum cordatum TaxID=2364126 RepID=A0ABN9VGG7_9DINO|nr:unnamed protein product [Polarella glacialis]
MWRVHLEGVPGYELDIPSFVPARAQLPFFMIVITCFISAMIQFKIAGPPSLANSSSSCIPERAKEVAKKAVQTVVLVCFLKGMINDVCIAWAYSMELLADGQPLLTVLWRGAKSYGLLVFTGPNADDAWKRIGLVSIYWDRLNVCALHRQRYSGGAHQETRCFSSGYPGFRRSASCAATSRGR